MMEFFKELMERAMAGIVSGLIVALAIGAWDTKIDVSVVKESLTRIEKNVDQTKNSLTDLSARVYTLDQIFATKTDLERVNSRVKQIERRDN